MNESFQKIFISITLVFFVFVIVYFFVMLSAVRQANLIEARDYIENRLELYHQDGGSLTAAFQAEPNPRVKLICLYSENGGILQLWSSSMDYMIHLPKAVNTVRGIPEFSYNDIYEVLIEIPSPEDSGPQVLRSAVVYQLLYNSDLKPIFMNMLYFLIAFASFTLLFLIIKIVADSGVSRSSEGGIEYHSAASPPPPFNPEEPVEQELPEAEPVDEQPAPETVAADEQSPHMVEPAHADKPPRNSRRAAPQEDDGFYAEDNRIWPTKLLKMRLNNEIERSAENETDIGFVVFRLGRNFLRNGDLVPEFEKKLLDVFRYEDLIFHLDKLYYGLILPGSGQGECLKQIEHFLVLLAGDERFNNDIYAGFSTRNGRLLGGERLMKEGVKAVSLANEKRGRIFGFKPDPQKYQAHLMGV